MANSRVSSEKSEQAIVDTAPAVGGYWTNGVLTRVSGKDVDKLLFTVRGSGTATPILQFRVRKSDSDWTDYYNEGVAFVVGDVMLIEANAAQLEWRAGVKEGGYTSGQIQVGFNW